VRVAEAHALTNDSTIPPSHETIGVKAAMQSYAHKRPNRKRYEKGNVISDQSCAQRFLGAHITRNAQLQRINSILMRARTFPELRTKSMHTTNHPFSPLHTPPRLPLPRVGEGTGSGVASSEEEDEGEDAAALAVEEASDWPSNNFSVKAGWLDHESTANQDGHPTASSSD